MFALQFAFIYVHNFMKEYLQKCSNQFGLRDFGNSTWDLCGF